MKLSSISAQARINFTLTLDATRKAPHNRAYIADKQRTVTRSIIVALQQQVCEDVDFFIEVSLTYTVLRSGVILGF